MSVLGKIVEWSHTRPAWQQAAIQLIYESGTLGPADISSLVDYCKAEHGLSAATKPIPEISFGDQAGTETRPSVRIRCIGELANVNALKASEHLTFSDSGLTLVFGDNGVGKSSYVRILKQACRSRGSLSEVHPYAYSDEAKPSSARITYDVDSTYGVEFDWKIGSSVPQELREVSILDSDSAVVYTDSDQDVAYLPRGLDIFVRLAAACDAVAVRLNEEIAATTSSFEKFEDFSGSTHVGSVLKKTMSSKELNSLQVVRKLSEEESRHLEALRSELAILRSGNIDQQIKSLSIQKTRTRESREKLERLKTIVYESCERLPALRSKFVDLQDGLIKITNETFSNFPVQGLDHRTWFVLWNAAKEFATLGALPAQVFPGDAGSLCPLCQQQLGEEAAGRLNSFAEFTKSKLSTEVELAKSELGVAARELTSIASGIMFDETSISELDELHSGLGTRLKCCADSLQLLAAELAISDRVAPAEDSANAIVDECQKLEVQIEQMALSLTELNKSDVQAARESELSLLEERIRLDHQWPRVEAQIVRVERLAKLQKCVQSTKTNSITSKGKELLASEVTAPLASAFDQYLSSLHISHIPIAFAPAKGKKGTAVHRVEIAATLKVPNSEVLSEGECRAIAIAGFFAEAMVPESTSTLVFDDPVSSLDLSRREVVANALVELAKKRPVIVFTHDMPFAWQITTSAETSGVDCTERQLRRAGKQAGVVSHGIEGSGVGAKKRIGPLKQRASQLQKIYDNDPANYDREARTVYGELREIWERSVEDVLFNGALRRFGKEVKTQSLTKLHLLTEAQVARLTAGMSKCSGLLIGHDQAAAFGRPLPEPQDVQADVQECENWIKEIAKMHV